MKNITATVDEETYRRSRVKAAELDTSVSALVKGFLQDLVSEESAPERARRRERELREQVIGFRAADRLSRDALYGRDP